MAGSVPERRLRRFARRSARPPLRSHCHRGQVLPPQRSRRAFGSQPTSAPSAQTAKVGHLHHRGPPLIPGAAPLPICVRADNSHQPNSRWYTGSGIYRHTWLVVTSPVHVAQWGTYVAVSQMTGDFAMVRVRTRLANDGKTHSDCTLVTTLLDKDGKLIQTAEGT